MGKSDILFPTLVNTYIDLEYAIRDHVDSVFTMNPELAKELTPKRLAKHCATQYRNVMETLSKRYKVKEEEVKRKYTKWVCDCLGAACTELHRCMEILAYPQIITICFILLTWHGSHACVAGPCTTSRAERFRPCIRLLHLLQHLPKLATLRLQAQ